MKPQTYQIIFAVYLSLVFIFIALGMISTAADDYTYDMSKAPYPALITFVQLSKEKIETELGYTLLTVETPFQP